MFSTALRSSPPVARDLMARNLLTAVPGMKVEEGLRTLLKNNHSGMPVVDDAGNYLGVFSEKCCLRALEETATLQSWKNIAIGDTQVMAIKLFCLSTEEDAVAAIGALLKHRVSGAPVIQDDNTFLGVFSEKTSMRVLIGAAYDSLPSATVGAYMDTDPSRLIDERTSLFKIATTFIDTPLRRLPVVRGQRVIGIVTRGSLLRAKLEMPSATVSDFMDRAARTVSVEDDILSLAEIFIRTPYRRLPVVEHGKLIGQVSRRDVLSSAFHLMDPPSELQNRFLYLSALGDEGAQRIP